MSSAELARVAGVGQQTIKRFEFVDGRYRTFANYRYHRARAADLAASGRSITCS